MADTISTPEWLKDIEITPCEFKPDLDDKTKFIKLDGNSAAKMQISSFVQHLPELAAISATSNLYTVTFPAGVPHTLSALKNGQGYFTAVRDPETGRFVGTAALNPVSPGYAIAASTFTVMSIATSQYYLTEINSKLNQIQLGVDKILEFLYGDKRAELMSEVSFAKYAYENYISIMAHSEQRMATISGLQNTRKIAMKDLEFYISDLDTLANELDKDIPAAARKAVQLKKCLDLSSQLYVISGLMEMYYSQNTDESYISYLESEMVTYLDKSEKHILKDYAKIVNPIIKYKGKEKIDGEKSKIKTVMEELSDGEESKLHKSLKDALHASEKKTEFYIRDNGNVYMRVNE